MTMPETRAAMPPVARPSESITRPPRRAPGKPQRYRRLRGVASIYSNCLSALQALRVNKMRSLLTSLGIIIGVGAVIVMISISESSAAAINNSLSGLNPTELTIFSGSIGKGAVVYAKAPVPRKR